MLTYEEWLEEALRLQREREARKDAALRAYASAYPCPGIEVEPGMTSGCNGQFDDCPTCAALSDSGPSKESD